MRRLEQILMSVGLILVSAVIICLLVLLLVLMTAVTLEIVVAIWEGRG